MNKTLKSIFLSVCLFISVIFGGVGCRTVQTGATPKPQTELVIDESRVRQIAGVCELAGYNGTYLYLLDNPEDKDKFELVVKNLDTVILGNLTVESFMQVVQDLPIKELQSAKGVVIVDSAIILWGIYKGDVVKLDKLEQVEKLTPIALGLRNGIARALKIEALELK